MVTSNWKKNPKNRQIHKPIRNVEINLLNRCKTGNSPQDSNPFIPLDASCISMDMNHLHCYQSSVTSSCKIEEKVTQMRILCRKPLIFWHHPRTDAERHLKTAAEAYMVHVKEFMIWRAPTIPQVAHKWMIVLDVCQAGGHLPVKQGQNTKLIFFFLKSLCPFYFPSYPSGPALFHYDAKGRGGEQKKAGQYDCK